MRIVTTKLFGAPLNRISTQHLLGCCESQDKNGGVSIMGIGLLVDETWPVETEETGFYYRPLYNTKINDESLLQSTVHCEGLYYLTRISRDSVFFPVVVCSSVALNPPVPGTDAMSVQGHCCCVHECWKFLPAPWVVGYGGFNYFLCSPLFGEHFHSD